MHALTKAPRGSVSWLYECFERAKDSVFAELVELDPPLANELLTRNVSNRNLKPVKLAQYVADVSAGRWALNGETIVVSADGQMNDGQHRCEAVVRSGVSIPVVIAFGVTRDSRLTVDQGAARTAGDMLGLTGIANANEVSKTTRLLIAYARNEGKNLWGTNRVSIAEIRQKLADDYSIVEDVRAVCGRRVPFLRTSHAAFSLHVFKTIHHDNAVAYINALITGEDLHRGQPAHTVRNRLIRSKYAQNDALEVIFRGFVAVQEGRELQQVAALGSLPAFRRGSAPA